MKKLLDGNKKYLYVPFDYKEKVKNLGSKWCGEKGLNSRKKEYDHVMGLIQNSSVVPEKSNLRYYIVSIDWFKRW